MLLRAGSEKPLFILGGHSYAIAVNETDYMAKFPANLNHFSQHSSTTNALEIFSLLHYATTIPDVWTGRLTFG